MNSRFKFNLSVFICLALLFMLLAACTAPELPPIKNSPLISSDASDVPSVPEIPENRPPVETSGASGELPLNIGDGLELVRITRYAGSFVEDGSDETVSDVCAITVRNAAGKTVQLAHVVLTLDGENFDFELTTLPAGASVQLLELSRKPMPESFSAIAVSATSYAAFDEEPSMYENLFKIETQNTAITVTNISEHDVSGQIYIYYKSAYDDLYMGGITYRVGVSGLAAGSSATCYAGHYSVDYSKLMFISYVQ